MSGETNLTRLLAGLSPSLDDTPYVYCSLTAYPPESMQAVATIAESEGWTAVLSQARADALDVDYAFACRRITLSIHSSLEAIGMMAAVSNALAIAGVPANTFAGFYHDHLFVPEKDVQLTMDVLHEIVATARRKLPV